MYGNDNDDRNGSSSAAAAAAALRSSSKFQWRCWYLCKISVAQQPLRPKNALFLDVRPLNKKFCSSPRRSATTKLRFARPFDLQSLYNRDQNQPKRKTQKTVRINVIDSSQFISQLVSHLVSVDVFDQWRRSCWSRRRLDEKLVVLFVYFRPRWFVFTVASSLKEATNKQTSTA